MIFSRSLRSSALQQLAQLSSAEAPPKTDDAPTTLGFLLKEGASCRHVRGSAVAPATSETSQVPMSFRELEVLLALGKAAPGLQSSQQAQKLLWQLSSYMGESFKQQLAPSPFLAFVEPSPWECLTSTLTTALLSIGMKFPEHRVDALGAVNAYLREALAACRQDTVDATVIAPLVMSLVGFLESSALLARFWSPSERLSLVTQVKESFSERFLLNVDDAFATLSISRGKKSNQWNKLIRHYESAGRPLGSMLLHHGLMKFLVACTSLLVVDDPVFEGNGILVLDSLMSAGDASRTVSEDSLVNVEGQVQLAAAGLSAAEEGLDTSKPKPRGQQQLACSTKAYALIAYCNCVALSPLADPSVLYGWLQSTIADPGQMSENTLAIAALKCLALLSKNSSSPPGHISLLHRFIVEGVPQQATCRVAAECLSYVLQTLPEDAAITTLNTLGHVLSSTNPEKALKGETLQPFEQQPMGSSISLVSDSDGYKQGVYANVVEAIVVVATHCTDPKMVSLALSVFLRRLDKVEGIVSAKILIGIASLVDVSSPSDFKSALDVYNRMTADALWQNDSGTVETILEARVLIAESLNRDHRLYDVYLKHLLHTAGAIGSATQSTEKKHLDEVLAAREIEQLIRPLATLLAHNGTDVNFALRHDYTLLLQNFWLNCAIHGIVYGSNMATRHPGALRTIARYTPPLVSGVKEDESFDKELDESSLLVRRMSLENVVEHKRRLADLLPDNELDIRSLPYARIIFLEATDLLESTRSAGGGCSKVLAYFVEPALKTGPASSCMVSIAAKVANIYVSKILAGTYPAFSSPKVADQLADVFVGCCHRLAKVQMVAFSMADRIMTTVPSALCSRASMYALLELLTLLWISCLERETDEYSTQPIYSSSLGNVQIEMPDSFEFRNTTLRTFHARAKAWVTKVLNVAHLDIKGLLQTYLSEFEDEASIGRVSLGRTFALEMGGAIPSSDQRLASIDFLGDCNANIASDFVKQYTVRQAYRHGAPAVRFDNVGDLALSANRLATAASVHAVLSQIESKDWEHDTIAAEGMKEVLRSAASLICRSQLEEGALIRHLVRIPFSVFTRSSIKLGLVLWVGVMNERPTLQSRMLGEILRNFERTVEEKMGLFAENFCLLDPFVGKMQYAPSDKQEHLVEQRTAGDMLYPHLRLLQLLSSHYHATRHGNPQIQKMFLRFIRISLAGLKHATGHPLAREARFQLVLLGLQILRYITGLTERQQLKLKDLILSGGLSWFRFPPQWSFGGNRLQVKAEAHLLQDVATLLNSVASIGAQHKAIRMKHDLLLLLVENESTRLATWLYPLDHSRKHHRIPNYSLKPPTDATLCALLPAAWVEDPAIVIQLPRRFQSRILETEVRRYMMNHPEKVIDQPDAAQMMLKEKFEGEKQPTFQLRYLLFWTPVDPITAVTFFLPSYQNNPFVLQYAMRSLESHSVDVTFFYVPQIVQTLRYDKLGYVRRFIIETAKFSQLFAHQIIWNIKANAYKDEDATIPDPVKPTLDIVEAKLIESFSPGDEDFYKREFAFFNEVTSISGKLRPYIKRPKPEKNQKIAEELAKIKVDVGVYLPSNPDSVVIDIDRASGKSLQSHAKAPFMATFKIRRKAVGSINENSAPDHRGRRQESTSTVTQEKMQAAIFKVGDDCRQDMLALQLISCFRSIFNSVGLDVYVFPYRVTATAPGCGVIDVLPKSISRDMLGRDYDMGLYDYFINKYGGEDSISFQNARNSFVKSMAAYSVISYLLKFKDRHNGNIMVDDGGHILHIDFGFCFDIAPGGITFERAPFKLTAEMISVMGGSTDSQSYLWFEELCIKSFLACRPFVDRLTHCVVLMLDSGLPCFKPETIQNFRDRFVLDKTDREAADYMRYLIKKSFSSYSTGQYDRFQHLTNGIPY